MNTYISIITNKGLNLKFRNIWLWNLTVNLAVFLLTFCLGCSKFVEVDPPKNILVSETIFDDPSTVESALANIYLKMRDQSVISGRNGLSVLMSIYSDELDYFLFNTDYSEFYGNVLTPSNAIVNGWWSDSYNIIYAANDIIVGIENSESLTDEDRDLFKGQALFVRAFMHSFLVELFGDIPYVTTTDYVSNNRVSRLPIQEVYNSIIEDLKESIDLLPTDDSTGNKVVPNKDAAKALLARMYLYTEDWELAAMTASELISDYQLVTEIGNVFLKESPETIWQFKPNGISDMNTYEGSAFIINSVPGQTFALREEFLAIFEPGDLRFTNWVGSHTSNDGLTTLYYPYKYKKTFSDEESTEHSIVFRLAEQYLIRAEARARLGNVPGAQNDLNDIRHRAGLGDTAANTQDELFLTILQERQVELFTEHGQRWFDLKRMNMANEVLSSVKENWGPTDILLPIPEDEIENNSNLGPQNPGY